MPVIQLPNGENAEFPDEMPMDQIKSVIQNKFPPQRPGMQAFNEATGIGQPNMAKNFVAGLLHGGQSILQGLPDLGKAFSPDEKYNPSPYKAGERPIDKFDAFKFMQTKDQPFYTPGGAMQLAGELYAPGKAAQPFGKLIKAGAEEVANKLSPANLLRGNLTPEELKRNLNMTKGTETSLGDVIGSPFAKRMYENVLSKIPFSGANEAMQRTAGKLVERGHGILNKLLGSNKAENFEQELNDTLHKTFKEHQANKIKFYTKADKLADEVGLKLDLPSFANTANKYAEALENTNILKYEPDIAALLNKLKNYRQPVKSEKITGAIVDKSGQPLIEGKKSKYPRLAEANILKGKFNELAEKYGASPNIADRHAASVFTNLAKSLKGDIESAIEKTGHPGLKSAYQEAEENYAKNFSPFLDREIHKFATGKADPDMLISSFIKTGKANDRANLINMLTSKLPKEKKNLLGYGYLSRAFDENNVLNPLKVKTLLSRNSLGPRQFKALFPDKSIRNSLMDFMHLTDKNTKGLKLMQNPETGQMSMDILPLLSKSKTSLAGKVLGARPAVNWLTSEKTREKLVNQMIANGKQKL